jgi:large subunit ribosomal protein L32
VAHRESEGKPTRIRHVRCFLGLLIAVATTCEEKNVGALPKKRQSNSRQGHRRMHHKVKIPNLAICPQCRQLHLNHHACPNCGTYRGRQVIEGRQGRAAGGEA